MQQEFKDDDQVYLHWLNQYSDGYVINAQRNKSPANMVLHRATCKSIRELKGNAQKGGFTERAYIKICDVDLDSLRVWFRGRIQEGSSVLREYQLCKPM